MVKPNEFWRLTVGELHWLREAIEDQRVYGKNGLTGAEAREIYQEAYGNED